MRVAIIVLAFITAVAAQPSDDPNADRDAKLIAEAKAVSVHQIDEALPDSGLGKWLDKQSGADAKYHWEVNDCGEQTGAPGDTGPVPVCVEVDVSLKDGRQIVIFITHDQAGKNVPPDWKMFFAQLTTPHEKINLRRLSDLPAALTKTHQLTNHSETAK